MIAKQDILDRAAEWQLRPDVVEKDYVLGWLLAILGTHSETADGWVFKGGTCLKKCYFETFRFSEDLDFSLQPDARYDEKALADILREVASQAHDASGLVFFVDDIVVRPRTNRQGHRTFEARLGYRGPMAIPGQPKVRFDLTRSEPIILLPRRREIFHPYPDELPLGSSVACYDFDELLAEKTRALLERTRPRDLYDIVLIGDNHADGLDVPRLRDVFARKCAAKGLDVPDGSRLTELARSSAELATEWVNMLGHQLPAVPGLALMLDRLHGVLRWLDSETTAPLPMLLPASAGGSLPPLAAPRSSTYWGMGISLDTVRFAGANRLLVEFAYDGKARVAEPYSLRRPRTGNLLLYAWDTTAERIKAFNVTRIRGLRVTDRPFVARFKVEFT